MTFYAILSDCFPYKSKTLSVILLAYLLNNS